MTDKQTAEIIIRIEADGGYPGMSIADVMEFMRIGIEHARRQAPNYIRYGTATVTAVRISAA